MKNLDLFRYLLTTVILCFTLGLSSPLYAGRYAGDFMEIGSGVRALGFGGAFTAVANDGSAIYWNASGISQIKRIEVSLMRDRKSTRLNSSHVRISYAVFCLKKKKKKT